MLKVSQSLGKWNTNVKVCCWNTIRLLIALRADRASKNGQNEFN